MSERQTRYEARGAANIPPDDSEHQNNPSRGAVGHPGASGADSKTPLVLLRAALWGSRPRTSLDSQNARLHWAARHARRQRWQQALQFVLHAAAWPETLPGERCTVRITVHQRRGRLPDSDNATGAVKMIRDAIAAWFGVDDGPSGPIVWEVVWQRGTENGVVLEVLG